MSAKLELAEDLTEASVLACSTRGEYPFYRIYGKSGQNSVSMLLSAELARDLFRKLGNVVDAPRGLDAEHLRLRELRDKARDKRDELQAADARAKVNLADADAHAWTLRESLAAMTAERDTAKADLVAAKEELAGVAISEWEILRSRLDYAKADLAAAEATILTLQTGRNEFSEQNAKLTVERDTLSKALQQVRDALTIATSDIPF